MRKSTTILFALAISGCLHASQLPQSIFYQRQLEALKSFEPSPANELKEPVFSLQDHNPGNNEASSPQESIISSVKNPESFATLVLALNPEIEKQKQMIQVANFNLSQTQALEPLLNQFSAFMSQTPTIVPLFKEHPFPGLSAIKLKIAETISTEAKANFNNLSAKLARQARFQAYSIIQSNRKISLLNQTIKLYQDLKNTSESLYRNGKISFAELTMISIEANRLTTQKNQYLMMLKDQQEKAFSMLNGKRPNLNLASFQEADFKPLTLDFTANLPDHPRMIAEKTKLDRLESSISMVQRMAFPEYTSISSLPMKKSMSNPLTPSGNAKVDAGIEFSNVFVKQLQARQKAQTYEIDSVKQSLTADFASHSEAFRLSKQNLTIIKSQMLPELEKAFASVKSRYESGQASFQELVETEKRLLQLKEKLIDSQFEALKAKANLLYDQGKIQLEMGSAK